MQKSWIETHFEKKECNKHIPSKESGKCGCGRSASVHAINQALQPSLTIPPNFQSDDSSQTSGDEHWSPSRHTIASPTDAYGTVEFQGSQHPLKAQFVRLSYDTKPELVLQLLTKEWHLDLPKLLITVHGGKANFELQPKLKSVLRKGLVKAAKTTGAWIFTAGTNTGVMRHVGEALRNERTPRLRSRVVTIGIAPWGIIQNHNELIGKNIVVPYYSISSPKSRYAVLNSNHSYFLLVDNGTVGKYGAEIALRKKIEKHISKQKIYVRSDMESCGVPVVCVVVEGGLNTIRTVLECVTDSPPVPVVICDGSGRAADLLAFAHKYLQDDDAAVLESVREQLLATIEKTFKLSKDQAEQLHIELVQCVRRKDLITVFRMGEGPCQELDQAVLTALLKGHHLPAPDLLRLALTWNRVDIARKEIFVYGQEWPEGSLQQAMMDALVLDRVDFVKLLLENGVSMQKFLTIPNLEELYNTKLGPSNILRYLVRDVKKHMTRGYRITLYDIGLVIDKLLGGAFRSSYCRRKFRLLYNSIMKKVLTSPTFTNLLSPDVISARLSYYNSTPFKYPFNDLLIWAVLTNRQKMALFMWQSGEEVIVKALIACTLYKAMAREASQDDMEADLYEEMRENARDFQQLALDLLDYCYRQDNNLTLQLLTYELQNWSKQTCLELAVIAKHSAFLAHTASQMLLADLWMGGLRTRKNATLKVVFGLLFPPAIFKLEFKSTEQLKLMPQTEEEHIWDLQKKDDLAKKLSTDETYSNSPYVRKESFAVLHAIHMNNSSKAENGKLLYAENHIETELSMDEKTKQRPLRLGKKIYEFYAAPITKFWGHTVAYGVFLFLYTYVVLVRMKPEPSWQEFFVISYLCTLGLEKIREITCSEPVKFTQKILVWMEKKWNPCDLVVIVFFLVGLSLRVNPATKDEGRVIYCVNIMYWYLRTLDIVSVNKYLGPYVTMIGKMVIDMIYFVVLLLVVLMSYGVARQGLLFPDESPSWDLAKKIFYMPYFMLYGEVFADTIDVCEKSKEECRTGVWINPVIMSIYLLIANILLVNLLIAVFNNIFVEVNAISQQVWKSQRFQVVMEYEQKPVLPPPLILFSHIYLLLKHCVRHWKGKRTVLDCGLKLFLDENSIEKLNDFEEECVESYFREKEMQATLDQQVMTMSERAESMNQRIEDIHQRQKDTSNWIQNMEFRLDRLEEVTQQTFASLSVVQNYLDTVSNVIPSLQTDDSVLFESENEAADDTSSVHIKIDKPQEDVHKESVSSRVSFAFDDKASVHSNVASDVSSKPTIYHRRLHRTRSPLLPRQQTIVIPDEKFSEGSVSFVRRYPLERGQSISYIDTDDFPTVGPPSPRIPKIGRSFSCVTGPQWSRNDPAHITIPNSPRPPRLGATKGEYTSITDDLENVACISQYQHFSFSRSNSLEPAPEAAVETETLHDAEELDYHLMEGLIQRRLHRNSENLTVSLEELCSVCSDTNSISETAEDNLVTEESTSPQLKPYHFALRQTYSDPPYGGWSETKC